MYKEWEAEKQNEGRNKNTPPGKEGEGKMKRRSKNRKKPTLQSQRKKG